MEDNLLIAVYDTTRLGFSRNNMLSTASLYAGTFISEPIYDLFAVNETLPYALIENGSTPITFDVFIIPRILYTNLVFYFKANKTLEFRVNKPIQINTPYGKAYTFVRDSDKAPKLTRYNIIDQINGDIVQFEKKI